MIVYARPASDQRGVSANRHERWSGMRWTLLVRETNAPEADGKSV